MFPFYALIAIRVVLGAWTTCVVVNLLMNPDADIWRWGILFAVAVYLFWKIEERNALVKGEYGGKAVQSLKGLGGFYGGAMILFIALAVIDIFVFPINSIFVWVAAIAYFFLYDLLFDGNPLIEIYEKEDADGK